MSTVVDDTSPDRRRTLRRLLASQRAELRERLRSLREAPPGDGLLVKDQEEQGLEDLVANIYVAVLEIEPEPLRSIVEDLRRVDEGTYGSCADCGEPIALARLGAVPFALRGGRWLETNARARARAGAQSRAERQLPERRDSLPTGH